MKKILKYSLFVLPVLAMIFIIVISCNKEGLINKNNSDPIFSTYEEWEYDTFYYYRSKAPVSYGDSTFLITIYKNSSNQVVGLEVELVASLASDKMCSFVFINSDIQITDDSIYFYTPEDGAWLLPLGYSYMINVPYDEPCQCNIIRCYCPADEGCGTGRLCWPVCDAENPCIQWCETGGQNPCLCECRPEMKCPAISGVYNCPVIFIEADIVEYNNVLYQ